jgi:phage terminase large subunit
MSTPTTADELAAHMYADMKAPSFVRQLYDAVQAAEGDARLALIKAAPAKLQRELAAYTQRRGQLVSEYGQHATTVQDREEWATWFRRDPKTRVAALKRHYRNGNIGLMIDDWGWTKNPKLANEGRSVTIPFRLWPKQFELIAWMWKHFKASTPAVCAKAREVGASWCAMAFAACLCVLFKDIVIGVVASTEDKLDSTKDPSPTLPKAREFLAGMPPELRAGYDDTIATASYLKVVCPETDSLIRGWTGTTDQGRGARAAVVLVDEAAFFENPHALDASLSAVTDCRLDFSSANGTGNPFFDKVDSGEFDTFWFTIEDDPRKNSEWIEAKKRVTDPVIWESEYKISFTASIESKLFEWKWVEAAVGLLPLLEQRDGFKNTGGRRASLDVSDQGKDKNCLTISHGVLLQHLELWSGAGSDQHATCAHAFSVLDERGGIFELIYDASVAGAGIAGAARILNGSRKGKHIRLRDFVGGSTKFPNPTAMARGTDRSVEDFFQNLKAFAYWSLRQRFVESWNAFNGEPYDKSLVICIDPKLPHLNMLQNELAQIQRKYSATDKLVIDKAPERAGKPKAKSPNCADSLSMLMGGAITPSLKIGAILAAVQNAPPAPGSNATMFYGRRD